VEELENALQSIVMKLSTSATHTNEPDYEAAKTLKQLRSEVLPPTPAESVTSPGTLLENAPVLSLFDNSILSRLEDHEHSNAGAMASPPVSEIDEDSTPKHDHIRRTLLSLFPAQELQDAILNASDTWWRASQNIYPEIYGVDPGTTSVHQFIAESKASGCVQKIAKALLCLSISLQEAPPRFNVNLGPSVTKIGLSTQYMNAVDDLVISDDDVAATIDGIECLHLRARHEINDGRIRKTWIMFRRALSLAQLLGLHVRPKYSRPSGPATQRRESLWKALYHGDRFVSLLLGLPYAVSEMQCAVSAHGQSPMDPDAHPTGEQYLLHLANIIGHIIDRNQEPPSKNTLPLTVKIEGELTDLAASMPREWWANDMEQKDVVSQLFSRRLPQFWHHQARTLLHLPFMLKAATDRRYEYNKIAALESAREMINLYQVFRPAQGFDSLVCKVIDFQAFTAGMVLVLNLLTISSSELARDQQEASKDEDLITTTTDLLQRASLETDAGVTTQAARALKMFCKARAEPCPPGQSAVRVVIPYFGTVVFGPGKNFNHSYLKTPEAVQQPLQLPSPEMETPSNYSHDMPGFDNYLGAMPSDLNFGGYPVQSQQGAGIDGGVFANVNLDLDQDWSWFWNNTNVS